ncbi:MAG: cation:proton antiporter [Verrucomicrobia bacterium]|nr:cation:proton antiporter [Verrucomicrobiota bacterium]MBS0636098.1 cation:proton antiporter [Verrucomicrobiota bacterium]
METHLFLLQIVLILLSARIAGELANWCKIPTVVGELCAGIILGPSLLGWISLTEPIQLLAQVGIILLLFEVGIEADVNRLISSGLNSIMVALGGIVMPFVGGFCVAYSLFSLGLLPSLFIASTLTATSIGITLRVLRDLKKQESPEAQVVLGAAVLDDIIGIILLSVLYEFATAGTVDWVNAVRVLLFILIYLVVAPVAAKLTSITIQKWDEKSSIPGLLPTAIISLILFFAWVAHELGAPELLGGFAAGLALSRHFFLPFGSFFRANPEFCHKVETKMAPIVHLFTPIFFVGIGLSLDLGTIDWASGYIWLLTASLIVVAVAGKLFSGFLQRRQAVASKLMVGMSMVPRGEVGLIFANIGLSAGVYAEDIYTSLILVIVCTTLFAPYALRILVKKAQ